MLDIFTKAPNYYVWAPATKEITCKLFRAQHDSHDPSHQLTQETAKSRCCLVPLRAVDVAREISFNYNMDEVVSTPPDPADELESTGTSTGTSGSLSLTGSSGDICLTGNGVATTDNLNKRLEARVRAWCGRDHHSELGF